MRAHISSGRIWRVTKYLLLCCSCLPHICLAQTILWQPEEQISNDTVDLGNTRVFALGDTVHIFWHQYIEQGNGVYYIRSTDRGITFSPPRKIWPEGVHANGSTSEITAHNSNLYILWLTCDTCDAQHYWVTFTRSTDGGQTFEPYRRLFPARIGSGITADDSLVVFRWSTRPPDRDSLAISVDHGVTWQNKPLWFQDFQRLCLAGSHLHMTEAANGTSQLDVGYRYSSDLGSTWTNEFVLSTADDYTSQAPSMQASRDGKVWVTWNDGKYGGTNLFVGSNLLRYSTDAGTTWSQEFCLTQIPSATTPREGIETPRSTDQERLAVVWNNESQAYVGINLALSTDGGESWLPPIAVSDSSFQALESGVALSGGTVHVVWARRVPGQSDKIFYRRGQIIVTGVPPGDEIPSRVGLLPAYPNPFNSSTTITYTLDRRGPVDMALYDVLGRRITVLSQGRQEVGVHRVRLDAQALASGLFFVRLSASGKVFVDKVLLVK